MLENKPKADYRFDLVTQADKLAEKLIRELNVHFTERTKRVLMTRYGGACYVMAMLVNLHSNPMILLL